MELTNRARNGFYMNVDFILRRLINNIPTLYKQTHFCLKLKKSSCFYFNDNINSKFYCLAVLQIRWILAHLTPGKCCDSSFVRQIFGIWLWMSHQGLESMLNYTAPYFFYKPFYVLCMFICVYIEKHIYSSAE